MGLFGRRAAEPGSRSESALTPEAVAAVLAGAGFPAADVDASGHALTEGFTAWLLPVTHEDRVGVGWHADPYAYDDHRGVAEDALWACASALAAADYQADLVAEIASDYLVVWLEGEF